MSYANVGMMHPVWAPLLSHTEGNMPTYGTGMVVHEARTANVTKQYADNPLRGDDRVVDDDNGLTGLTMSFESTGLDDGERVAMLGEMANTGAQNGFWVSDNETPWGGFGYVRKMRLNGESQYEAWITLKIKFQEETQNTATKENQINWNTPTLNGRAAGLIVDNTGLERYQLHNTFSTAAEAKAWIDGILNVSAASATQQNADNRAANQAASEENGNEETR